jgi:hypothetical protein
MATATAIDNRASALNLDKQFREVRFRDAAYRDAMIDFGFGLFADSMGMVRLTPQQIRRLSNLVEYAVTSKYIEGARKVLRYFDQPTKRILRLGEECWEYPGKTFYQQRTVLQYVDAPETVTICARKWATIAKQSRALGLSGEVEITLPESASERDVSPFVFRCGGVNLALCYGIED